MGNKTFINLDFLFLTETWLEPMDTCLLSQLLQVNYNVLNTPRSSGHGGGVATLFKDSFKCILIPLEKFTSFILQLFKVDLSFTVYCALIYCPPKYEKGFIQDISDFLSFIVPTADNLLILGYFNIHIC